LGIALLIIGAVILGLVLPLLPPLSNKLKTPPVATATATQNSGGPVATPGPQQTAGPPATQAVAPPPAGTPVAPTPTPNSGIPTLPANAWTVDAVKMRTEPSTDGGIVTTLPANTAVQCLAWGEWAKITNAAGTEGYVKSAYLTFEAPTTQQTAKVRTADGTSVNLRAEANGTSTILAPVPDAATVTIVSWGAEWSQVKYNDQTGYIKSQYLERNP